MTSSADLKVVHSAKKKPNYVFLQLLHPMFVTELLKWKFEVRFADKNTVTGQRKGYTICNC